MPAMDKSRMEGMTRAAAAALLFLGCLLVLRPFIGAILFAGSWSCRRGPRSSS
jgi:hypothetical protein